jgi:hypothetical protein
MRGQPRLPVGTRLASGTGMRCSYFAGALTALAVTGLGSAAWGAQEDLPLADPAAPEQPAQAAQSAAPSPPAAAAPSSTSPALGTVLAPVHKGAPAPRKPCDGGPCCKKKSWSSGNDSGVFGLRAAVTRLHGMSGGDSLGLSVWAQGEDYRRDGIWSMRGLYKLGIGGGGSGLDGALFGDWAGGVRVPLGRDHGPVLRMGLQGYLRGNDSYYASLIELPQLQLGYQYMRGNTVVELGGKAGAVLTGRERIGDARRVLGTGLEYGGYGALQLRWMRAGIELTRMPVDDRVSTPVDVAEGTLCVSGAPFAICADARAAFTKAELSASEPASKVRSVYAGLLLGFTGEGKPPHKRPPRPRRQNAP